MKTYNYPHTHRARTRKDFIWTGPAGLHRWSWLCLFLAALLGVPLAVSCGPTTPTTPPPTQVKYAAFAALVTKASAATTYPGQAYTGGLTLVVKNRQLLKKQSYLAYAGGRIIPMISGSDFSAFTLQFNTRTFLRAQQGKSAPSGMLHGMFVIDNDIAANVASGIWSLWPEDNPSGLENYDFSLQPGTRPGGQDDVGIVAFEHGQGTGALVEASGAQIVARRDPPNSTPTTITLSLPSGELVCTTRPYASGTLFGVAGSCSGANGARGRCLALEFAF